MNATSQNDVARPVWQNAAKLCAECNEMRSEIALRMRQVSAIELHSLILPLTGDWSERATRNTSVVPDLKLFHGGADALVRPGSATDLDGRCRGAAPDEGVRGSTRTAG